MKQEFSTSWVSSKQPRKQHKYLHNAPLHIKHTFLNAHLSKDLRKKYGKRNLPLRKGDEVLIVRGAFRKKKAKVNSVDHKRLRVALEGIQRTKKDGTKVNAYVHPSALIIISLDLADKERMAALNRKTGAPAKLAQPKQSKSENKTENKPKKNASN